MLTYLDNVYNVGEKSERAKNADRDEQIGLNDGAARELMELHTTSLTSATQTFDKQLKF